MKKGFTLIELLVVIAIIAILAAILFPVFAQAKMAAKKAQDISNLKQIGTASKLYLADYDDLYFPHRFNCGGNSSNNYAATQVCSEYLVGANTLSSVAPDITGGLTSNVNKRAYFVYLIHPYVKSYPMYNNPGSSTTNFYPGSKTNTIFGNANGGVAGNNDGGQNSYAYNLYLSPSSAATPGLPIPISETGVPRVATTILAIDARYYAAAPDVTTNNESGYQVRANLNGTEAAWFNGQNTNYIHFWMNIGNANWTQSGATSSITIAKAKELGNSLYGGKSNAVFVDGHAKTLSYSQAVGNVCWWSTDADGSHPGCN